MPATISIPVEVSDEFLADVITCAMEGGIGYWSVASHYQYISDAGEVCVHAGTRSSGDRDDTYAVVREIDDDGEATGDPHTIDSETIVKGLGLITGPEFRMGAKQRGGILAAVSTHDAGMIDSDDADVIVQAGLFGKVVYG